MKSRLSVVIGAAFVLFSAQASSQESLIDHVVTACEDDINMYCSQVTPGEGRLLHCAAAHEDKLSGRCEYALYQAATILEEMTNAMASLINSCRTDAEKLCSDVAMGEGRLLSCLEEKTAEVSDTCNQAIADTVGE